MAMSRLPLPLQLLPVRFPGPTSFMPPFRAPPPVPRLPSTLASLPPTPSPGTAQGTPRSPLAVEDTMVSLHRMSVLRTAEATVAALIPEEFSVIPPPVTPVCGFEILLSSPPEGRETYIGMEPSACPGIPRSRRGACQAFHLFQPGRLSQGLTPEVLCLPVVKAGAPSPDFIPWNWFPASVPVLREGRAPSVPCH